MITVHPTFQARLDKLLADAIETAPKLGDDALLISVNFHSRLLELLERELHKRQKVN